MGCLAALRRAIRRRRKEEKDAYEREAQCCVCTRATAFACVVLPALAAVVSLRLFAFGLYVVPTGFMLNTIHEGDYVFGEKVTLAWDAPGVGDIVTFESPERHGITLVKRVVAIEEQMVDVRDGIVVVDGAVLDEPYAIGTTFAAGEAQPMTCPHTVAEGCVWVMGDNREVSRDSRWFGDVPLSSVTSCALAVYWPLGDVGVIADCTGDKQSAIPSNQTVAHSTHLLNLSFPRLLGTKRFTLGINLTTISALLFSNCGEEVYSWLSALI